MATPIIAAGECILIGALDGTFYAWDVINNKVIWTLSDTIDSAAFIAESGEVYVSTTTGHVHRLNEAGSRVWTWDNSRLELRRTYSPSTIYWFEANVIEGPSGLIYAACDDFYLYALAPSDGSQRWAFPTGFNVWAVPAFGSKGSLYFGSFDTRFYAVDFNTGKLRWSFVSDNLIVSSAAVTRNDCVMVGTLGGRLHCLRDIGPSYSPLWQFITDGAIYASPALSPDENYVFIGSMNGWCYCIDTKTGHLIWRRFLGGPIVSSMAIAIDPLSRTTDSYLILAATRTGLLFALTPDGSFRWTFNPVAYSSNQAERLAGFTSSWAVSERGMAIASSDGEVFYMPHDFYLSGKIKGLSLSQTILPLNSLESGPRLFRIEQSGRMIPTPLPIQATQHSNPIGAFEVLSFRGLRKLTDIDAEYVRFLPGTLDVTIEPPIANVTAIISSDQSMIHVIPNPTAHEVREQFGKSRTITISVQAKSKQGSTEKVAGQFVGHLAQSPLDDLRKSLMRPWTLRGFAFHDPAIINAFDEFGIASIEIRLCVFKTNESDNGFIAWGTGILSDGIPEPRRIFTLFKGECTGGEILLRAVNCDFEITAAALPLDELRLSAVYRPNAQQTSDFRLASSPRLWSGEPPLVHSDSTTYANSPLWPNEHFSAIAKYKYRITCKALWAAFSSLLAFLPPLKLSEWGNWWLIKCRAFGMLLRFIVGRLHGPWQLLDPTTGQFCGVGTFRAFPLDLPNTRFEFKGLDRTSWWRGILLSRIVGPTNENVLEMSILLIESANGKPINMDYSSKTSCIEESPGNYLIQLRSICVKGKNVSAYIIVQSQVIAGPIAVRN